MDAGDLTGASIGGWFVTDSATSLLHDVCSQHNKRFASDTFVDTVFETNLFGSFQDVRRASMSNHVSTKSKCVLQVADKLTMTIATATKYPSVI